MSWDALAVNRSCNFKVGDLVRANIHLWSGKGGKELWSRLCIVIEVNEEGEIEEIIDPSKRHIKRALRAYPIYKVMEPNGKVHTVSWRHVEAIVK